MSFPPEHIKHLPEVEEGQRRGTFIACILCFIYGSRETPEGIIMSLDVSRAAVIGGAVVEATLAKQSQHFSIFFCVSSTVFFSIFFLTGDESILYLSGLLHFADRYTVLEMCPL